MSHELRTPLNSLLILSKDLSSRKKNLDDVQVESAEIIYKSGHDLLILINEVLDLSKIEAGKMSVNVERIPIKISLLNYFKILNI
jgi:signal transduction histidine kinase